MNAFEELEKKASDVDRCIPYWDRFNDLGEVLTPVEYRSIQVYVDAVGVALKNLYRELNRIQEKYETLEGTDNVREED